MRRLELDPDRETQLQEWFRVLVIIAALATLPLSAAYFFDWDHWAITVADWTIWSIFLAEYGFFMAISSDRWRTTKNMWLSAAIVVFSFPLLHEVLQSTRLIRLVRPAPLLKQGMVIQQVQMARLTGMRARGTHEGWAKAKEKLGEDHWITRWMVYLERLKAWIVRKLRPGRWGSDEGSEHSRTTCETD